MWACGPRPGGDCLFPPVSAKPKPSRSNASKGPISALLGRGSIYTLATAAQLTAGVLVIPVLTRLVEPAEMGVIALAIVVTAVLAVIAGAGLPAVVVRTYFIGPDGPAHARRLLRRCLVAALLVAAVAETTGPLWSELFGDVGYGGALRLAVWAAVPMAMLACSQSILRAEEKPGRFVASAVVATAVGPAAGLVLVAAFDGGAEQYVLGMLIGQVVAATLACGWAGLSSFGAIPGGSLTREALRIGLPTVSHSLAIYVLAAGDRVVVEALEGIGQVGRYQVAYQIGALVLAIIVAFNNAWDPIIFGEREERRWQSLAETRAVLHRIAGMLAASLALGAPLALLVAAPDSYDSTALVPVTAIVAVSAIPMVSYMASYHVLLWRGRTGVLTWATPLAAVTNIGLNLLLVPTFGLEGAAVCTVLSYCALALLTGMAARRHGRVPGGMRAAAIGALWAGSALLLSLVLPNEDGWVLVRGLAALAVLGLTVRFAVRQVREARSEPLDAPAQG